MPIYSMGGICLFCIFVGDMASYFKLLEEFEQKMEIEMYSADVNS